MRYKGMWLPLLTLLVSTLVFSAASFLPASTSTQTPQYSGPPGMPSNAFQYNRTDVTPNRQREQILGNNTYVFAYRNVTLMMTCSQNTEMNITIDPLVRTRYLALVMEQNQSASLTMNISVSPPPGVMTMQRTLNFYWGIEPNATLQMRIQLKLHINATALNAELNRVVNTSRLCWMYWNTSMNCWRAVESYIDREGYLVCETTHLSTWTVSETAPGMPTTALNYDRTDLTPYKQREHVLANNTYVFAYRNVTLMMTCSQNTDLNMTVAPQVRTRYVAMYLMQNQSVRLDMTIATSPPTGVMTMLRTLNFYWGIESNATIQLTAQLRMYIDGTALNAELGRVVNTSRLTWMYWNTSRNGWDPVDSWKDDDGYLVCNTTHVSTWTIAEVVPLQVTGSLSQTDVSIGDSITVTSTVKDDEGNLIEGATVTAVSGSVTLSLSDKGSGIYEGTLDTSNLGEGTVSITVSAEKTGYGFDTAALTLSVQPVVPWTLYAIIGIIVAFVALVGVVFLTRRR
jgi:hypothetical protein